MLAMVGRLVATILCVTATCVMQLLGILGTANPGPTMLDLGLAEACEATPLSLPEADGTGPAGSLPDDKRGPGKKATEFVRSCEKELSDWRDGIVPSDRYWRPWNAAPAPWCSEFVGWNLANIGLVEGETMPANPSYAEAYYEFYSRHPEVAEIHENDGTYVPQEGDIVLTDGFSHTEMVARVDADGLGWDGISGGGGVGLIRRATSDMTYRWFVTLTI